MRKLWAVFTFFTFFTFFLAAFAYPYSGAKTECLMAVPAPVIDGVINEGEWGEGLYLDKFVTSPGEKNYNGFGNCYKPERIKDEKDCSGTLYYLWEPNFLYLAAKVTDDDLYFGGDRTWRNDCTEWRWDPNRKADDTYIGMWITPKFQGDNPGWERGPVVNDKLETETEELPSLKTTIHPDGYEWELRIPANSDVLKDIKLRVGEVIGFTVSISDFNNQGKEGSMPAWSLKPGEWSWSEEFWGEIEFSREPAAVQPSGKLATSWGSIKQN